jgi:hypothetical protein
VESAGVSAYDHGTQPAGWRDIVYYACCVCLSAEADSITLRRIHAGDGSEEVKELPLFADADCWAWEAQVREALWRDARLPFWGGPEMQPGQNVVGYLPAHGWQVSQRPSGVGYRDAHGGVWEWESGRAATATPFGGHWNVQLDAGSIARWERFLCDVYARPVRIDDSHVNVEPDGRIVDDGSLRLQ